MNALIAGASPDHLEATLIAALAESSDLVIAADGGADTLMEAGVPIDLWVGDGDSITARTRKRLADDGVPTRLHPPDKDETDLDLAIGYARDQGARRITVIGATGGRLDHSLAAIGSLAHASDLHPRLLGPGIEAWILSCDGRVGVTLQSAGRVVSVFAIGEGAVATSTGLRWELDGVDLSSVSSRGQSNTVVADEAHIQVGGGVLFVIAPLV